MSLKKKYPIKKIILGDSKPRRALISAGIHGDEPAGIETICVFLESKKYDAGHYFFGGSGGDAADPKNHPVAVAALRVADGATRPVASTNPLISWSAYA